jgi:hypothetical protein
VNGELATLGEMPQGLASRLGLSHLFHTASITHSLKSDCRAGIQSCIRSIFTHILYPALIFVIFLTIFVSIIALISRAKRPVARARRITAALLPVVVLVYRLVAVGDSLKANGHGMNRLLLGLAGLATGLLFVEFGRVFVRSDSEAAIPFYILLLSSLGSFMFYFTIQGSLDRLDSFLFPLVIAAGLDVVFRGPPAEST